MVDDRAVSIVIVNWNGKHVLEECLRSVSGIRYPIRQTIVVDNGSRDGSVEMLESRYRDRVTLIRNDRNLGAPVGRNQGMRAAIEAGVEFVFALDNDLTAAPDAIGRLVGVMDRDPKIAMAGALILHQDRPDVIFSAGHVINWTQNLVGTLGANRKDRGEFKDIWDVDYVGSGAVLARATFLEQHGLFDESYIGYGYEDTEFGYRANRLGYRVVCCADARVWHRPHSNIGRYTYRKKYLETRNAVRFIKKYGTAANWAKYLVYVILGFGYASVVEGLRGNFPGVRGKIRGFFDGLRNHDARAIEMLNEERNAK